jgi:hypothetical protein
MSREIVRRTVRRSRETHHAEDVDVGEGRVEESLVVASGDPSIASHRRAPPDDAMGDEALTPAEDDDIAAALREAAELDEKPTTGRDRPAHAATCRVDPRRPTARAERLGNAQECDRPRIRRRGHADTLR